MTFSADYEPLAWIGALAKSLEVYARWFDGAAPEIMGESPYLNAKSAGISFALEKDGAVRTVFFYSQGFEDFAQYAGPLPAGLTFASSRAEVRAALGGPSMSGEPGGVGLMAIEYGFDRFENDNRYVHFQYTKGDNTVLLVTIGAA
jgi:hypothetical protein